MGMQAPVVAVGDGALGFWAAVRDVWPETRELADVLHHNPAADVRGPAVQATSGKTPVLWEDDTRRLLDAINVSHVVGLRDRALIATYLDTAQIRDALDSPLSPSRAAPREFHGMTFSSIT